MTRQQAIALANSKWWEGRDYYEVAKFQLFEPRLCMPFGVFHEALEKALGRPVWTHELGSQNIDNVQKEFLGDTPAPTMDEILSLIPADKRIILEAHRDRPNP